MNWKIKALLQKLLSFTKIGDTLNHVPATLNKKHHLNVLDFIGENYKERIELDATQIHPDILAKYNPNIDIEDLTKYQRGTLIISK